MNVIFHFWTQIQKQTSFNALNHSSQRASLSGLMVQTGREEAVVTISQPGFTSWGHDPSQASWTQLSPSGTAIESKATLLGARRSRESTHSSVFLCKNVSSAREEEIQVVTVVTHRDPQWPKLHIFLFGQQLFCSRLFSPEILWIYFIVSDE